MRSRCIHYSEKKKYEHDRFDQKFSWVSKDLLDIQLGHRHLPLLLLFKIQNNKKPKIYYLFTNKEYPS